MGLCWVGICIYKFHVLSLGGREGRIVLSGDEDCHLD